MSSESSFPEPSGPSRLPDTEVQLQEALTFQRQRADKWAAVAERQYLEIEALQERLEAGGPSRLRAQLQDAIQQLKVYQMEGEIDGKPFVFVLVRRHEVHQLVQALVGPVSVETKQLEVQEKKDV